MKTVNEATAIAENPNPAQVPNLTPSEKITGLSLISEAMNRENFDIDVLKELVKMQNDMEDRDAKKEFNRAFSEMMQHIPIIAKTGVNTFNGTKFAKLEDIVETTRPILSNYGFSVTYKQSQEMIPGAKTEPGMIFCHMTVTCVLKHRFGHEETNEILLPIATIKGQTPIQAMGAGSTYGRRYTLMQALNIATAGEDNDGNLASFAHVANNAKKPIKNEHLALAIQKAKEGSLDLVRQVLDKRELTEEQKDFLNGQLFGESTND